MSICCGLTPPLHLCNVYVCEPLVLPFNAPVAGLYTPLFSTCGVTFEGDPIFFEELASVEVPTCGLTPYVDYELVIKDSTGAMVPICFSFSLKIKKRTTC